MLWRSRRTSGQGVFAFRVSGTGHRATLALGSNRLAAGFHPGTARLYLYQFLSSKLVQTIGQTKYANEHCVARAAIKKQSHRLLWNQSSISGVRPHYRLGERCSLTANIEVKCRACRSRFGGLLLFPSGFLALQPPGVPSVVVGQTPQHLVETVPYVCPHGRICDKRISTAQRLG